MKNRISFLFVLIFCCQFIVNGQHKWCGFHKLDSIHYSNDHNEFERVLSSRSNKIARAGDDSSVFLIPVVVHVIHNNSTDEIGIGDNISDEQIFSAIEVLNEDFRRQNADTVDTPDWAARVAADMQVEFRLATQDPNGLATNGITRTKGERESYSYITDEFELKGYSYWPSYDYLNIWVARLSDNIIGFAQFPDGSGLEGISGFNGLDILDGIVITPFAFGRLEGLATGDNNPYKLGRTAVHEVGHWLGLRHTFDDYGESCSYTDYCEDTPSQVLNSSGFNACGTEVIGECGSLIMYQNYMDYTDDICMNLFTEDQKNRVQTVLEVSPRRAALSFSKGLCGSSGVVDVPSKETFLYDDIFFSKWKVYGSNTELFDWELETGEIKSILADSTSSDSIVLESGVITYDNTSDLYLRFDAQSFLFADSIKIYYERACSGNVIPFRTVDLNGDLKDNKFSLKGLTDSGLLKFYFVVYNNGNEVVIRDISFYEESNDLDVELFPTPSDGNFSFDLELPSDQEINVNIFDLNGRQVYEVDYGILYTGIYDLDLTSLWNGMFIVKFTGEDDTKTIRFIKE